MLYKNIWIDTELIPGEVVALTPDIERYFDSVDEAKSFIDEFVISYVPNTSPF